YHETEELRLRAKVDEFEIVTRAAGHDWALFDLTNSFPNWLASQRYAKSYFQKPNLLSTLLPKYLSYIEAEFDTFLQDRNVSENFVVELQFVCSLLLILKIKEVVDMIDPRVKGRLLVFYPGSYEDNNYHLLDGYDAW